MCLLPIINFSTYEGMIRPLWSSKKGFYWSWSTGTMIPAFFGITHLAFTQLLLCNIVCSFFFSYIVNFIYGPSFQRDLYILCMYHL